MPATMKNFYSESFSHEYFQQRIFPNYGTYTCDMYVYYIYEQTQMDKNKYNVL